MKETVVATAFMFELILFEIFGQRNGIIFYPLYALKSGLSNVIWDLLLQLFGESINK